MSSHRLFTSVRIVHRNFFETALCIPYLHLRTNMVPVILRACKKLLDTNLRA